MVSQPKVADSSIYSRRLEKVAPDVGCNVYPECLTCPLVQCQHDEMIRTQFRKGVSYFIYLLQEKEGLSMEEVADFFEVEQHVVWWIISTYRKEYLLQGVDYTPYLLSLPVLRPFTTEFPAMEFTITWL